MRSESFVCINLSPRRAERQTNNASFGRTGAVFVLDKHYFNQADANAFPDASLSRKQDSLGSLGNSLFTAFRANYGFFVGSFPISIKPFIFLKN